MHGSQEDQRECRLRERILLRCLRKETESVVQGLAGEQLTIFNWATNQSRSRWQRLHSNNFICSETARIVQTDQRIQGSARRCPWQTLPRQTPKIWSPHCKITIDARIQTVSNQLFSGQEQILRWCSPVPDSRLRRQRRNLHGNGGYSLCSKMKISVSR